MRLRISSASCLALLSTLAFDAVAGASQGPEPELNPFTCQGDAEVASEDRSIAQVREELVKKLAPPFEATDTAAIRAKKFCVIARLKARVGAGDAVDYFERAIAESPREPGYELFAGQYYAGARGAKGPVLELAEKHFYRALEKLKQLESSAAYRPFHASVEDQARRGLLDLYQQDGVPLLPWKAFPQRPSGYLAPGLSVSTQLAISRDTRSSLGFNDALSYTAEAGLFKVRRGVAPSLLDLYDIARQPLRISTATALRFRQTHLGAIDFSYGTLHAPGAAITDFGHPGVRNDIDVKQAGLAYERVIPLYPVLDFKLAFGSSRVERRGVVEYLPDCTQTFPVYSATPSVSRFVGSDKLTLNAAYVLMDIPNVECGAQQGSAQYLNVRGRAISAISVEYAFYSPLLLPSLHLGSLRPYRTPTRGLYLSAGYVNDNEVFGDHRTINETLFVGARLEGPGVYDVGITETLTAASGTIVDARGGEHHDPAISGKLLRSALTLSRRLTNPDASPGVPAAWGPFANGSLSVVFPVSFDKVVSGYDRFENLRAGAQLWWKIYGTGLWGTTALLTAGYEYAYFYHLGSAGHRHNLGATLRIGWRDL